MSSAFAKRGNLDEETNMCTGKRCQETETKREHHVKIKERCINNPKITSIHQKLVRGMEKILSPLHFSEGSSKPADFELLASRIIKTTNMLF